jgi:aryl-alcohol dehydrogenase-like predicted oxidoreductase
MRLSTESTRDELRALETLQAALDAGVTTFDTARSYAIDEHDLGHYPVRRERDGRRDGACARYEAQRAHASPIVIH